MNVLDANSFGGKKKKKAMLSALVTVTGRHTK
jgi:hypothetical protein